VHVAIVDVRLAEALLLALLAMALLIAVGAVLLDLLFENYRR